jgi:hypothetical protein
MVPLSAINGELMEKGIGSNFVNSMKGLVVVEEYKVFDIQ